MKKRLFCQSLLCVSIFLLLVWGGFSSLSLFPESAWGAEEKAAEKEKIDPRIIRRAADSLWRLKRAIQRDAYPSARAALNIWRSNAGEAGNFDAAAYEEYRRQICEKSVRSTLDWFEESLEQEWFNDAGYSVQVYKLHSRAIDTFDQKLYDNMLERIQKKKAEVAAREKAEKAEKGAAASP